MTVSLPQPLEKIIDQQIARGRFHSAQEVVEEGLRLLSDFERLQETQLTRIREEILVGLNQLKNGEGISGSKVLAEMKELSQRRRAKGR